jgi:hypothetical protein
LTSTRTWRNRNSFRQFATRGDIADRVKARIRGENAERFFAR